MPISSSEAFCPAVTIPVVERGYRARPGYDSFCLPTWILKPCLFDPKWASRTQTANGHARRHAMHPPLLNNRTPHPRNNEFPNSVMVGQSFFAGVGDSSPSRYLLITLPVILHEDRSHMALGSHGVCWDYEGLGVWF